MYRYTTESSLTFGPSYFIGSVTTLVRVLHFFRGCAWGRRVSGQRGNDALALAVNAQQSAPPSPSTRALNVRRRRRRRRPHRRPLARARPRSARRRPTRLPCSQARVGQHPILQGGVKAPREEHTAKRSSHSSARTNLTDTSASWSRRHCNGNTNARKPRTR